MKTLTTATAASLRGIFPRFKEAGHQFGFVSMKDAPDLIATLQKCGFRWQPYQNRETITLKSDKVTVAITDPESGINCTVDILAI
jgi:hypothetical protein